MRALLALLASVSLLVVASAASAQQPYPPGQQYAPPPGQQYAYPPPGQQYAPPPGQQQYAPPPGQQQYAYPPNQGVYLTSQGYGTAQVPPQVVAMQQELAVRQQEYASYSLGGPIALMIGGFVTFVVSGLVWIGFGIGDDLGGYGPRWETTASGIISLVGLALGIVGIGWLVSVSSERGPIGRRIRDLKQQLHALGVMANLDLAPVAGGAVGSIRFAL